MRELDKIIRCMERGFFRGQMENYILENMLMIRNKDMEYFNGQMGENLMDIG